MGKCDGKRVLGEGGTIAHSTCGYAKPAIV